MNKTLVRALIGLIVAVILPTSAADAAQPAVLKRSPPLRRGVAAFPRLVVRPGDRAAARINRSLKEADQAAVVGKCDDYRRRVRVTMRGPRYASFFSSDDWFCGGAYPDNSEKALVYDLATGAPANWEKILTPALVEKTATVQGGNDSDPVLVVSSVLWKLYAQRAQQTNKDCASVFADPEPLGTALMVWPDAEADGLVLRVWDWPHVVKACAVPITLALSELRKLGLQSSFVDAIDEAHRRGWYDKSFRHGL
jgi:hypothetical protein